MGPLNNNKWEMVNAFTHSIYFKSFVDYLRIQTWVNFFDFNCKDRKYFYRQIKNKNTAHIIKSNSGENKIKYIE